MFFFEFIRFIFVVKDLVLIWFYFIRCLWKKRNKGRTKYFSLYSFSNKFIKYKKTNK